MKKLLTIAMAIFGITLATPVLASHGPIVVVVPDWTGGQVSCQILAKAIEKNLGHKVERLEIPSGPAVATAMAGGDADVGCELWPSYWPSKEKFIIDYGGDGAIKLAGEHGVVGQSSYYVPRYLVEGAGAKAPGLKHITDLKRYVSLFRSVDTGNKGRLIGCPIANWECEDKERIDAYGLPFELVELGSETAQYAEMQGAYARGEPFVAYAYEPHWIHVALDLVPLVIDDYEDGCRPKCGWPTEITYNYTRDGMRSEHPDVVRLVQKSKLTNEQQNPMTLAIDVEGRDLEEVVDEWMRKNAALVRSWGQ